MTMKLTIEYRCDLCGAVKSVEPDHGIISRSKFDFTVYTPGGWDVVDAKDFSKPYGYTHVCTECIHKMVSDALLKSSDVNP